MSTVSKVISTNKAGNPDTGISICIPRVFSNIGFRRIKRVFIDLNWGFVERVDVVPCGGHKRAFVHFAPGRWNMRSQEAVQVLKALQGGVEVKVFYESDANKPWFWKISLSRAAKPAEAPKPKPRPKIQIVPKSAGAAPTASAEAAQSAEFVPIPMVPRALLLKGKRPPKINTSVVKT